MKYGLMILLMCFLSSCTGGESREPVVADPAFAGIDPDQKALPKDAAAQGELSLGGQSPALNQETSVVSAASPQDVPPTEAGSLPPPTPPIDQLTQPGSYSQVQNPERNVDSASAAEPATAIGSGPHVRYIKAFELNIRSKPNRRSQIVGRLKGRDEVHVSIHGGWSKLDDSRWIRTRWLVKSPPEKLVNIPPDEEGKPARKKKTKQNPGSRRVKRGAKS